MKRRLIQALSHEAKAQSPLGRPSICSTCLLALRHRPSTQFQPPLSRHASTSTAAALSPTPPASPSTPLDPKTGLALSSPYTLKAGIVLSRPPQITRDLTPFEKAFYFYQRRLNERLALPFTRYFYFEKNTPADLDWKRKSRLRMGTAARDIGMYSAYSEEAWNDELLVGARESEPEVQNEALLRDAVLEVEAEMEGTGGKGREVVRKVVDVERPETRETEADREGDVGSLNRMLQRTLYLVVKGREGGWGFPEGRLEGRESLHRAAERVLVQSGGINMNTWIVGNAPVGYYVGKAPAPEVRPEGEVVDEANTEKLGEKTFFMKARIMAGQFDLSANKLGLRGYKWLAKEELEKEVDPVYWKAIRNMLVDL